MLVQVILSNRPIVIWCNRIYGTWKCSRRIPTEILEKRNRCNTVNTKSIQMNSFQWYVNPISLLEIPRPRDSSPFFNSIIEMRLIFLAVFVRGISVSHRYKLLSSPPWPRDPHQEGWAWIGGATAAKPIRKSRSDVPRARQKEMTNIQYFSCPIWNQLLQGGGGGGILEDSCGILLAVPLKLFSRGNFPYGTEINNNIFRMSHNRLGEGGGNPVDNERFFGVSFPETAKYNIFSTLEEPERKSKRIWNEIWMENVGENLFKRHQGLYECGGRKYFKLAQRDLFLIRARCVLISNRIRWETFSHQAKVKRKTRTWNQIWCTWAGVPVDDVEVDWTLTWTKRVNPNHLFVVDITIYCWW